MSPIPEVNVNITCNSDCNRCCPKKLKFFCFCWCCTCGCKDVIAEKAKDVAEKSFSKSSQKSMPSLSTSKKVSPCNRSKKRHCNIL